MTGTIGLHNMQGFNVSFCVSTRGEDGRRETRNLAYRAAESNEEDFLSIDLTPPVVQAGTSDELSKKDSPSSKPTFLKRFNERK